MLNRLDAPGFGLLSQEAPDKRFMLYWLYYCFNRHVGEWALATDGGAPYYQPTREADRRRFSGPLTPVLATLSRDERELDLVIANGSWTRAVPCRVAVRSFAPGRITGVVLTNHNLDVSPLLARKEDAVVVFTNRLRACIKTTSPASRKSPGLLKIFPTNGFFPLTGWALLGTIAIVTKTCHR